MSCVKNKIPMKTALFWQIASCVCAFFACSFVTGLEGLFCAFAAAFAAALILSGAGALSLLSTAAGGLLGYAFALWSENGGLTKVVLEFAPYADAVEVPLDLRVLGVLWLLCLGAMTAVSVYALKKGYARTVCVGANTMLLILQQAVSFVWIFRARFGVFSWELLREKMDLLGKVIGEILRQSAKSLPLAAEQQEAILGSLGRGLVYTLPLVGMVLCGVFAFFHSFLLKRLLKKSHFFSEGRDWVFMPSLTGALVYVGITVCSFAVGTTESGSPTAYGLELLDGFLSWLYFVPGLSALRAFFVRRGQTSRRFPWLIPAVFLFMFPTLIGLVLNLIPTVGLVYAIRIGLQRRAAEKQNMK